MMVIRFQEIKYLRKLLIKASLTLDVRLLLTLIIIIFNNTYTGHRNSYHLRDFRVFERIFREH